MTTASDKSNGVKRSCVWVKSSRKPRRMSNERHRRSQGVRYKRQRDNQNIFMENIMPARFPLGQIVATPGCLEMLAALGLNPTKYLARHASGDWGDVCPEDKQLNDEALVENGRLLSAYDLGQGERLWIITESDRSSTCLLLPDEY